MTHRVSDAPRCEAAGATGPAVPFHRPYRDSSAPSGRWSARRHLIYPWRNDLSPPTQPPPDPTNAGASRSPTNQTAAPPAPSALRQPPARASAVPPTQTSRHTSPQTASPAHPTARTRAARTPHATQAFEPPTSPAKSAYQQSGGETQSAPVDDASPSHESSLHQSSGPPPARPATRSASAHTDRHASRASAPGYSASGSSTS